LTLHLERLIPIHDAAKLLGLSETRLRELVQAGTIKGAILPGGDIGVSENAAEINALNEKLQAITQEQFIHLRGNKITITDAEQKYGIPNRTIRKWIGHNYIQVIDRGYPVKIDEGNLAYCAAIYSERQKAGVVAGAPLLNEQRKPYLLKHPGLSEYRRRKRTKA